MFLGSIVYILLKLFKVPVDPFHNKSKPLPGAALRAAFGEAFLDFHATVKGVLNLSKRPPENISIVTIGCLKFTLDLSARMIKDVKQLDCPENKTWDLIKKIWYLIKKVKKGEKVLDHFREWNKLRNIYSYSKIEELVSTIIEFCLVNLPIQLTLGEPMWEMVQTHCPQFEIEGTSISFFFCV